MFKVKNLFLSIFLLMVTTAFAVETTYNQTVAPSSPWGASVYSGTVTFTNHGSGDIYYTQSMLIGTVNKAKYGWFYVICSEVGTEDVNVFFEYSFDNVTWVAGSTDSNLDAVGTTAVTDTVGVVLGTACQKYQSYCYMRIKYVTGQAIDATVVTWKLGFSKPDALYMKKVTSVVSYSTS